MAGSVRTTGRLLDLLALLQRQTWTGPELAEQLGVTGRSVRRDVQRLRDLGFPVEAAPGAGGGYRLVAGGSLPPLVLDDEAAVAVAVCLRLASLNPVQGIGEAALRAMAVIDQVLPARLRRRVDALQASTDTLSSGLRDGEQVDGGTLLALAQACRVAERVHVDHRSGDGTVTARRLEPHRLVTTGRRWYLLAWDLDRDDWRTFRVDRLGRATSTGWRFAPREAPPAVDVVQRSITQAPYPWQVRLRVAVDPVVFEGLSRAAVEVVEGSDGAPCELRFGVHRLRDAVTFVTGLLADHGQVVEVLEPAELLRSCAEAGDRLARTGAAGAGRPPQDGMD